MTVDRQEPVQARLAVEGAPGAGGTFEILAITAGEGNGWLFGEDVLRASLGLWNGAACFVDHALLERVPAARSVRDLAGTLDEPQWDAARRGIRCRLTPFGPSAPLLVELGRQLLAESAGMPAPQTAAPALNVPAPAPADAGTVSTAFHVPAFHAPAFHASDSAPRVGFSADVVFTAQGRRVQKILRVLSVDLVIHPARGGAFLRALNSLQGSGGLFTMNDAAQPISPAGAGSEPARQPNPAVGAGSEPAPTQPASAQPAPGQPASAQPAPGVLCASLLEATLAAARLPGPVQARVRQQFAGRAFEPAELNAAVADARALLADLTGPTAIQGPGRVSGMVTSEDQFSAAIYDLLGAERPGGLAGVHAARLSGIRELYTRMTGDLDFTGGYDPQRVQFSTTTDLPGVLKNAMNRLIAQEWRELGRSGYRWWEKVVSVEHFTNLQQITGVLVGEVTVLPQVEEGEAYAALGISDSPEVGGWTKYGGYIGLSLEMFERDQTHRLRQYPRKLAASGLRRISALVGSVFTAGEGAGPAMADGTNVFHADHDNLGSAALDADSWEAASAAIWNQPMLVASGGTAPVLAVDARYLVVPRGLRLAAMQILYPNLERAANIFSENMQKGELGDVVTCPELTGASDWAAVADPRLAPAIIVAERYGVLPEIIIADGAHNGALFTHDEIRMKARHWLSVFVADYRPLYKAVVSA